MTIVQKKMLSLGFSSWVHFSYVMLIRLANLSGFFLSELVLGVISLLY